MGVVVMIVVMWLCVIWILVSVGFGILMWVEFVEIVSLVLVVLGMFYFFWLGQYVGDGGVWCYVLFIVCDVFDYYIECCDQGNGKQGVGDFVDQCVGCY